MNTPDNENKNNLPWTKPSSTFGVTGALSKNEEAGTSGEAAAEPEGIISNVEALSETNTGSIDISLSDATKLPALISERKKRIKQLQKKVKNAEKKAKDAKERAEEASELSAGFGKKKVAIEGLQDAQVEMAKAIAEQSKAQAALQEYQTFITQVTESLFALGVTSLAMNRTVVRELKESLSEDKNAKNKLDKYAREEILNVIKQLKAQEDIMIKQEQTVDKVKSNKERLDLLTEDNRIVKERSLKNEEELERQAEKDVEHDTLIAEQAEKDIEHDKALAEQAEKDIEHDKMLAEQAEKDIEHDKMLAEQAEKDIEHDEMLAEQAEKDIEHDKALAEQVEKDSEHDKLIAEQAETIKKQETAIGKLNEQLIHLEEEMAKKASKSALIATGSVGAVLIAVEMVLIFLLK